MDDLNDQRRNRGPRVRLTAVEQRHLPALWELIQDPEVSRRWRTAGASVSPEEFSSTFWDGVLVQHLAVDAEGGQPVAWLICYDANHRQSRAYFAVVGFPEFLATRALRDAIHLFIDYLFETWPFRQVLIDVPEFNLQGIEHAILRAGERVAVIPEYLYMYGCWWSLHTFAIRRGERLEELRRRLRREREVRVAAGPFEFDVNPGGPRCCALGRC